MGFGKYNSVVNTKHAAVSAMALQGLRKAVLAKFVVAGIGLEHRLEAGWRAAGPATLRAGILLRAAETFLSKDL